MPPSVIELRPDRSLLNSEFEGYKLSLESIPLYKKEIPRHVDRVLPSDGQYSILHANLFGLHNHLVGETINEKEFVYFIDKSRNVNKYYLDAFTCEIIPTAVPWTVPINEERTSGDYNISFKFASNNLAVVSDGIGTLYIVETGPRFEDRLWNCVFSEEVLDTNKPFIIKDAVCVEDEHKKLNLHCLLLRLTRDKSNEKFLTVLNWVTFSQEDDRKWGQIAVRELQAGGSVYYSYFESTCQAVYIASDNSFKFTIDSENPIVDEKETIPKKIYMWTQTGEDLTVQLKLPSDFDKVHLDIHITSHNICVKYKSNIILAGELHHKVDNDLTTWTIQNNTLEIVLIKYENGLMWSEFIKNNTEGEYFVDPTKAEEIHKKLAHLCSDTQDESSLPPFVNSQELEECDFQENHCSNFERLCAKTHKVTHKINLTSHKLCLTVQTHERLPPSIALTHDVDGCIWQPKIIDGNFTMEHIGTLLAFGYIQVSKQQRKFTVCSPDLGYTVICETNRHLFIYRQNKPILNAELRSRITSRKIGSIAQQQVISLDNEEVLGIYAGNSTLFILNENYIFALKI